MSLGLPQSRFTESCLEKPGDRIDLYNHDHPSVDKMEQIIQIASDLSVLHEQNTPHGSICPTSVLVGQNGILRIANTGEYQLLLCTEYIEKIPIPSSWAYQSSDVLEDPISNISMASDVYSFACLIYKIFTGQSPFHGMTAVQGIVSITRYGGHRAMAKPATIPISLWTVLLDCWAASPIDRPSMAEVLKRLSALD